MPSFQTHPDEGLLLRYFDGELPARKARQVSRHLNTCWQCRAQIDEWQQTVADCVRYRKNVLGTHLPPPPAPWTDLSNAYLQIDAGLAGQAWAGRLGRWLAAPAVQRWAVSGVVTAAIAAAVFYQFHETPSVQAAALLKRAVAVAQDHPQPKRQIRVRTGTSQFLLSDRANASAIEILFRTASYNPEDPLTARSYQQWRENLPEKSDEVTELSGSYRIRTVAARGNLAVASLTLRSTDLHPLAGRFEFRDREWVELSEIPEPALPHDDVSVETNGGAPIRRAEPSRLEPAGPATSALISQELQVVAALHGIGADLGDPVEVTRSERQVRVSGLGVAPARQKEIHRVLGTFPDIAVEFASPLPSPAPDAAGDSVVQPGGGKPGALQSRFERHLGGRAEFARFSAQILDWNEAAMSRAYALRGLAQRFPADATRSLRPLDREVLTGMARDHLAAMAANINSIQHTLAPVLVSLGGATAQGRPVIAGATWQDAAETVFQASRRVELLLASALGVTQDSGPPDQLPSDLIAALADLQASLESFDRLL